MVDIPIQNQTICITHESTDEDYSETLTVIFGILATLIALASLSLGAYQYSKRAQKSDLEQGLQQEAPAAGVQFHNTTTTLRGTSDENIPDLSAPPPRPRPPASFREEDQNWRMSTSGPGFLSTAT